MTDSPKAVNHTLFVSHWGSVFPHIARGHDVSPVASDIDLYGENSFDCSF